jgi:anti-anti-sigma factor
MTALLSEERSIIHVTSPLVMPIDRALSSGIRTLLGRGARVIVLDLAQVSHIDAAGVGELLCSYNIMVALHGVLRIVHVTPLVREVLTRAGVFGLLTGDDEIERV